MLNVISLQWQLFCFQNTFIDIFCFRISQKKNVKNLPLSLYPDMNAVFITAIDWKSEVTSLVYFLYLNFSFQSKYNYNKYINTNMYIFHPVEI